MGEKTGAQKVLELLKTFHTSVKAEELGKHEVDNAGNPIGSISERNHQIAEKARILRALNKKAELNAEDMALARQLGINVGLDTKDPTQFDL